MHPFRIFRIKIYFKQKSILVNFHKNLYLKLIVKLNFAKFFVKKSWDKSQLNSSLYGNFLNITFYENIHEYFFV